MMSLGAKYLRLRQKYQHGPITAHYRDRVRYLILKTYPIKNTLDKTCEIHVFTSRSDYINLIWCLKTFYVFSKKRYTLCIHGDNTLQIDDQEVLQQHFPSARIIDWDEAEARVLDWLAAYPFCRRLRLERAISVKEFDFLYFLRSERMMILDSDVLFFRTPDELIRRIEDPLYVKNAVNGDIETAYSMPIGEAEKCLGHPMITRFNSGLGLVQRTSLRREWFEEFLKYPGILDHKWRFEQTLLALASSRFGGELLPPEYDIRLSGKLGDRPVRHYVGEIRHLFYREGLARLIQKGFLDVLRSAI